LDSVIASVESGTPSWQHARLFFTGDMSSELLPNPRFEQRLRGLGAAVVAARQRRAARRAERDGHVLPHAQGIDRQRDDLWLFSGRDAALTRLCRWLREPATSAATLAVTGGPGSGKSSLLARLFVLADPALRDRVPGLAGLPEVALPEVGSLADFVHARGLTAAELLERLGGAARRDAV